MEKSSYVDEQMSRYIHLSKYSRWMSSVKRRENWDETVGRLIDFWKGRFGSLFEDDLYEALRQGITDRKVMPSMRTLMTAGAALDRDEIAGFNCCATGIDDVRVFDEIFYLLMCGCGVGFSVENKYTSLLPRVAEDFYMTDTVIRVKDSKIGWAKGLKELISLLYTGNIPKWDLSKVRPAGARLKTFGGRASGPEPLDKLFHTIVGIFMKAKGRRLTSIEAHDVVCWIAKTVIVGSVRRSACISLGDLFDALMSRAKSGEWYYVNPQRALANISAAYDGRPDVESFAKEFKNMYTSKAGERGIVNKSALRKKAESCGREYSRDYLLNPCGEAILRDNGGICNLSEVVIRKEDTLETLKNKVELATILGTFQSTLTRFRYLRKQWRENQEEERLLGVSLTGIMDNTMMSDVSTPEARERLAEILKYLHEVARDTNHKVADILGIPHSKQLTLIKPSGTVSQLCGTASGIHPRYAPYYLRRVTQDDKDPLTDLMINMGIPYKRVPEDNKVVFSFPVKAPEGSICAKDIGAMEQLELWKIYREHWCDGNPSQTIYYTDDTFFKVQAWVYENFEIVGGLSFFPFDDFIYDKDTQPYLPITKEDYENYLAEFPENINWDMTGYETDDNTTSSQELACAGGACEL